MIQSHGSHLLKHEIKYHQFLLNLGYEYTNKIRNNVKKQFWNDILLSWSIFQKTYQLTHITYYIPSNLV